MATKKWFFINCAEAENFCDKSQYKEISFLERLKLSLHLRFCQACRDYHTSNGKLTLLLKKARIETCTKKEKQSYKEQIKRAIR